MNAKNLDILIVGAVILLVFSAYIFPPAMYMSLSAIAVVALAVWFLFRIKEMEHRSKTPADTKSAVQAAPEHKSAQDIIAERLESGAFEKALSERADRMFAAVADDLLGSHGDVTRKLKEKLRDTMNPYLDEYDFSSHTVKLELLLNGLVEHITANQDTIIKNLGELMKTEKIESVKASDLFETFAVYVGENVETRDLAINYDDSVTYENVTGSMSATDNSDRFSSFEKKTLTFACAEDPELGISVGIRRWKESSSEGWTIDSIRRSGKSERLVSSHRLRDENDLTSLETPLMNLRDLNELELYFMKLHFDNTAIILDEKYIEDEDIEVQDEPEAEFH